MELEKDKGKFYTGIDYFRLLAAFLIIAIHTSPLTSYTMTGDFILTRIIARIAVPFFFMTSGFFLISKYQRSQDKLVSFLKKTALIYGGAILLYIPINIYNDYFSMDYLLPNIIKDVIFDGTLYHLWYLPATMLGALIAWILVKRLHFRKALIITGVLYLIGLFGDSYYGLIEGFLPGKQLYGALFTISDHTRNGLFYAPIFFVLGGCLAGKAKRLTLKISIIGFASSFLLMLGEAMLLHHFDLQRHDSMYVFPIPCMYFLFSALTYIRGPRKKSLRTTALLIYIIHPMMIVAVRLLAKIVGLEAVLIDNSLIHFLVVCLASAGFAFAVVFGVLWLQKKTKQPTEQVIKDRAWIEVNKENLRHNVETLQSAMPEQCQLMAVVKANAYGHGDFEIATYLDELGVKAYAVATLEEGIRLRSFGVTGEILILGYTSPERIKDIRKYDLTQTLINFTYAAALYKKKVCIKVHIKVDTGMHRLGFACHDTRNILKIFQAKYFKVEGIYTHLCVADSLRQEDIAFTEKQIDEFYKLLAVVEENNITLPKIHIQSSYGFLNYPKLKCDYVRAGVALYGVKSSAKDQVRLKLDLRPVLTLKSQIILLRKIREGESVGYARSFVARRDSRIAIVPIGYADGLPRSLSGENGSVMVQNIRVPIIGRICMDQLAIDVTDIDDVAIGTQVIFIGAEEEQLSAGEVADNAGTISNDLLSGMGTRLPVIMK